MGKTKIVLQILGLVVSAASSVGMMVIESRRKTKLTESDKEDIADRVVNKLTNVLTVEE